MSRPAFPGFALSTAVLWLLTGALYKLFDGSPNDLPPSVVEGSPLDMFGTFRSAIAIELAVVGLVFSLPRVGWVFLAGTFVTFLAILTPLMLSGAESCGCFGSNVTITPQVMMAIDGGLLLLLLFSKPWRLPKDSGLGGAAFLPFLVMAIAAPTMKLERGSLPEPKPAVPVIDLTDVTAGGEDPEVAGAPDDGVEGDAGTEAPGETDPGGADPIDAGPADAGGAETPDGAPAAAGDAAIGEVPAAADPQLPEFWELEWATWDGKDFYETDLASFADQSQGAVLPNSHVVVYRQTCEVCKEHLETLWEEAQNDPTKWSEGRSLVLVRIVETKDTPENNVCQILPEPSQKVTLPALRRGYGITTPLAFDVDETNVVRNVTDVRKLLGHD